MTLINQHYLNQLKIFNSGHIFIVFIFLPLFLPTLLLFSLCFLCIFTIPLAFAVKLYILLW